MKRIGKFSLGGLAALTLTIGIGGTAVAAPAPTTTPPPTPTSTPTSTSTSIPAPSTPSTSTPAKRSPLASSKPKVLTGVEIWRIVKPGHAIDCARAPRLIKRIQRADAAASRRAARWQAAATAASRRAARRQGHATAATTHTGHRATTYAKHVSARLRSFQKLGQDGAALIKRIDSKCAVSTPAS